LYAERFAELLVDLQSQLPTRKYTNALIIDLNVLVAIHFSALYKDPRNQLFRDLVAQLEHYLYFAVNSYTSAPMSDDEMRKAHCKELAFLQRIAIRDFKEKLTVLALSNFALVDRRDELLELLAPLTDEEVALLCEKLHLRTSYPEGTKISVDRAFLLEVLVETFQRRESFIQKARNLTVYPNEVQQLSPPPKRSSNVCQKSLFDPRIQEYQDLSGSRPIPLPKINLQYLTVPDFLYRSFLLSRYESLFQVRNDIEDVLRRMRPEIQYPHGTTVFNGYSKMSIIVPKVNVIEIQPPKVGESYPASVRGEVYLDLEPLPMHARKEWASIRVGDVIFLLSVKLEEGKNGAVRDEGREGALARSLGIRWIRTAEISQILDESGRALKQGNDGFDGRYLVPRKRTLGLRLDARQWKEDNEASVAGQMEDVYDSINIVVRRRADVPPILTFSHLPPHLPSSSPILCCLL
jgi:intron-binding protein aquarius